MIILYVRTLANWQKPGAHYDTVKEPVAGRSNDELRAHGRSMPVPEGYEYLGCRFEGSGTWLDLV